MEFFKKIRRFIDSDDNPALLWCEEITPFELHQIIFTDLSAKEISLLKELLHRFEVNIHLKPNYTAVNDLTGVVPAQLGWFTWFRALEKSINFTITAENWLDEFFSVLEVFNKTKQERKDIRKKEIKEIIRRSYSLHILAIFEARLVSFGLQSKMKELILKDSRVNADILALIL